MFSSHFFCAGTIFWKPRVFSFSLNSHIQPAATSIIKTDGYCCSAWFRVLSNYCGYVLFCVFRRSLASCQKSIPSLLEKGRRTSDGELALLSSWMTFSPTTRSIFNYLSVSCTLKFIYLHFLFRVLTHTFGDFKCFVFKCHKTYPTKNIFCVART